MIALRFASCYVYSPRGKQPASARSRVLCALLKAGDSSFMSQYARRVCQLTAQSHAMAEVFDRDSVLIPVPGSAPSGTGFQSVAERLARALVHEGLGRVAWAGLRRTHPVLKSGTAAPERRPTIETHYASFAMEILPEPPPRIVLVDDVITRGRTLLAAARCVEDNFPSTQIMAFALVRTMGFAADVAALIAPCRGEIRWKDGDACRSP